MTITNRYSSSRYDLDSDRDLDPSFGENKTFSLADANQGSAKITNSYAQFHNNHFGASTRFSTNTQRMVQNMVTEAINHNGITVRYMPRINKYPLTVFNESPENVYHRGMQIDVLLESASGFDGLGIQLSNVGLQFNQEVMLKMSISRYGDLFKEFKASIGDSDAAIYDRHRPLEGDIIVIPFGRSAHNKNQYFPKFFEITECTTFMDSALYQLGDNFQFDIRARLFDLSAEDLEFSPVVQEYSDKLSNIMQDKKEIKDSDNTVQGIIERSNASYDSESEFNSFSDSDQWDSYATNSLLEARAQVDEVWVEGKVTETQDVLLDDLTAHAFGVSGIINNLDDI